MASIVSRILGKARVLRRDLVALFYAVRDPAAPLSAKLVAILAVIYALSPIDLVPDVIPFVGLLDDLILVPLGMTLAFRLLPPPVVAAARLKAQACLSGLKKALLWMLLLLLIVGVAWYLRRMT